MADGGEKASLGNFVRKQTKYGTTTNSSSRSPCLNEKFLKHQVSPTDTLQGIALKHGVTMEQIKRANNMWTNDSLFLREFLLIPLSNSSDSLSSTHRSSALQSHSLDACNGDRKMADFSVHSLPATSGTIVTKRELQAAAVSKLPRSSSEQTVAQHATIHRGDSAKDFLSRFDTSLAKIKTNVQHLEATTEFPDDPSNPLSLLPTRRSSHGYSLRYKAHSLDGSTEDLTFEPQMMFKSGNPSRPVHAPPKKVGKDSDDLFQL